ncbi:MAG TPA: hypothetical protein PKD70_12410 [Saprospiraceae bacterium]|nr:hypothetical protein [Saprospiraceae bacterium]HMP14676.1 hypothetical protein [Saprospiraceae bacterium]
MNIAFSTILVFILLLPGASFSRFYYSAEFSKQYFKSSPYELFIAALIPSLILHFIALLFIRYAFHYTIDIEILGLLLAGSNNHDDILRTFKAIEENLPRIVSYHFCLIPFAALVGVLGRFFVRKFKLDRRFALLRFQNEWHYIISGEILDYPGKPGGSEEIDFVYADAMVNTAEGSVIYSGIVYDYVLSKNGGLDRLYLSQVKRRFLNPGKMKDYDLQGQVLSISNENIVNLHFTYYEIQKIESSKTQEPSDTA